MIKRANDTLLGKESDDEEVDSESGEESDDNEESEKETEQPAAKKTKTEKFTPQPRAVKEAKRDKKDEPAKDIADAERNLAKKAIVNKKRKRLLERIEKVSVFLARRFITMEQRAIKVIQIWVAFFVELGHFLSDNFVHFFIENEDR